MTELRVKHIIQMPDDILKIKDVFIANGFKLFLVGGSVRDCILSVKAKDFDLVTDAVPDKVIELLKGQSFVKNILETGKAFGVINVITPSGEFEIATMRTDVGQGRRPDSVIFTTIDQDVLRRDLTINSLFFDIDTNEIVDLVGGIDDLKKGIIRTVGKPEDRFGEDRLRIMRVIRFAARFDSSLDFATDLALRNDSSLEGISAERIRDEFLKSIKSAKSIINLFQMYFKFGLLNYIFGRLHITLHGIVEERNSIILIANVLRKNGTDFIVHQLSGLKYTSEEIAKIAFLVRMFDFKPELVVRFKKYEIMSKISPNEVKRFAELNGWDMKMIDAFINFKLSVTGDMMMKQGMKPGPEMGSAIEQAEFLKFKEYL